MEPDMVDRWVASIGWTCLVLSLAANARGAGRVDSEAELDSIVYAADLVIEGRLVEPNKEARSNFAKVRVTAVYRGSVNVGQTIFVMGMDDYRKPSSQGTQDVPLGPKDHLVMMLRKAGPETADKPSPTGKAFAVMGQWGPDFGMRLVLRGTVRSFYVTPSKPPLSISYSWREPRPLVAATTRGGARQSQVDGSIVDFREQLRSSARRAGNWHDQLDPAPSAADTSWLISLLRERYMAAPELGSNYLGAFDGDQIANHAARNLTRLGDLSAIDRGLQANPRKASCVREAFATPRGRDFLLDRIADRSLSMVHRQLLAHLLNSDIVYGERTTFSATTHPSADQRRIVDSACLARIARLTAEISAAGDDDLATVLLYAIQGNASNRNPWFEADFKDAAEVLRQLYVKTTASGAIRFHIEESLCAISEEMYEGLRSPCGSILTLVTSLDDRFGTQPSIAVGVNYRYQVMRNWSQAISAFLVLEPVAGGSAYVLPSRMNSQWHILYSATQPTYATTRGAATAYVSDIGTGVGSETINLPAGFQPGRYRLHYRLMDGEKIISEGHGLEATLPLPLPQHRAIPPSYDDWFLATSFPLPFVPPAPVQAWPRSRVVGSFLAVLALPMLLLLRTSLCSHRQRRRQRKGLCPQCAYDLHFSSGRCPECGRPIAAKLERGMVRRSLAKMALPVLAIVFVTSTVAWARSYWVCDCWVRTMADRADSLYYSRGTIVLDLLTTDGEPGWRHERADRAPCRARPRNRGMCRDGMSAESSIRPCRIW
jgi:hypothetical protein